MAREEVKHKEQLTAFTTTTVLGGATKHASGLKAELLCSGHAWRHHRRLLMHCSEGRRARQRRRHEEHRQRSGQTNPLKATAPGAEQSSHRARIINSSTIQPSGAIGNDRCETKRTSTGGLLSTLSSCQTLRPWGRALEGSDNTPSGSCCIRICKLHVLLCKLIQTEASWALHC